jgi:predicted RNA-binding protein with RPS1 domain
MQLMALLDGVGVCFGEIVSGAVAGEEVFGAAVALESVKFGWV